LNHPNVGGYLQWVLYPKYRIFMDMEVPFLFTDEDMLTAKHMFTDKVVFEKVISRYDPSFITVPFQFSCFKDLISHYSQYQLLFFDDVEVLYVNKNHFPRIAQEYQFRAVEPFTLLNETIQYINRINNIEPLLAELKRVFDIYNESSIVNQSLTMLFMRMGEYEKALSHGDIFVRNYPESYAGYLLKAEALEKLERFSEAVHQYSLALKRKDSPEIHRRIGLAYFKQGEYRKAYNTLVKFLNIYSPDTTYRELYYLIVAALKSNKLKEATLFFSYAYQGIPPNDTAWIEKYETLRKTLGIHSDGKAEDSSR